MYRLVSGEAMLAPVYTCMKCGVVAEGMHHAASFVSFDALSRTLDKAPPPSRMPVGWASHYDPKSYAYTCPRCNHA